MVRNYHTVIVGGGIAGLNAARFLQNGSVLFEAGDCLGEPLRCGEGISLHAILREGLLESLTRTDHNPIHSVMRYFDNGISVGNRQDQAYALVIDKTKLCNELALLSGTEIRRNTRIQSVSRTNYGFELTASDKNVYTCTNLILATGPGCRLVRQLTGHPKGKFISATEYFVSFDREICHSDTMRIYMGNETSPGGYAWMFPKDVRSANIGIAIRNGRNQRHCFKKFLERLRRDFGDVRLIRSHSGIIPLHLPVLTNIKGLYIVGDAGGFVDPAFLGGMNLALMTGRVAAESIVSADYDHFYKEISGLPFTFPDLHAAAEDFFHWSDTVAKNDHRVFDSFRELKEHLNQRHSIIDKRAAAALSVWERAKLWMW